MRLRSEKNSDKLTRFHSHHCRRQYYQRKNASFLQFSCLRLLSELVLLHEYFNTVLVRWQSCLNWFSFYSKCKAEQPWMTLVPQVTSKTHLKTVLAACCEWKWCIPGATGLNVKPVVKQEAHMNAHKHTNTQVYGLCYILQTGLVIEQQYF